MKRIMKEYDSLRSEEKFLQIKNSLIGHKEDPDDESEFEVEENKTRTKPL